MGAELNARVRWRAVSVYAVGVWSGLTAWAALAQYVLPGRGHALGKLGAFYWVPLINLLPTLLCALGFAAGMALVRRPAQDGLSNLAVTLVLGLLFPLTVPVLRPLFDHIGAGMMPALVWWLLGSAGLAAILRLRGL